MTKRINIAIDGPSGAGKSTISELLAQKLEYAHLDTGAMYRAIALYCKNNNISADDEAGIVAAIQEVELLMKNDGSVVLNGEDVSSLIRQNDISMLASAVSRHRLVRSAMVFKQQEITKGKGYIVDGRDIGTVVLPNAEVKFFLTATAADRALRRIKQYQEKGIEADYQQILKDIEERDYQDSHRANSPLRKADDAYEIDSSNMTLEEVVAACLQIILEKIN